MNIYDIEIEKMDGSVTNLSEYKGKVLIIVNTAIKCGLAPQYAALQEMYEENNGDLVVLDFPCNQFANQSPGTSEENSEACQLNYGIKFPQFAKVDVNGDNASELFKHLKEETKTKKIKWNFGKFLVDKDGNVVSYYKPLKKPRKMDDEIKELLKK